MLAPRAAARFEPAFGEARRAGFAAKPHRSVPNYPQSPDGVVERLSQQRNNQKSLYLRNDSWH
jgi:hypothetical protein